MIEITRDTGKPTSMVITFNPQITQRVQLSDSRAVFIKASPSYAEPPAVIGLMDLDRKRVIARQNLAHNMTSTCGTGAKTIACWRPTTEASRCSMPPHWVSTSIGALPPAAQNRPVIRAPTTPSAVMSPTRSARPAIATMRSFPPVMNSGGRIMCCGKWGMTDRPIDHGPKIHLTFHKEIVVTDNDISTMSRTRRVMSDGGAAWQERLSQDLLAINPTGATWPVRDPRMPPSAKPKPTGPPSSDLLSALFANKTPPHAPRRELRPHERLETAVPRWSLGDLSHDQLTLASQRLAAPRISAPSDLKIPLASENLDAPPAPARSRSTPPRTVPATMALAAPTPASLAVR